MRGLSETFPGSLRGPVFSRAKLPSSKNGSKVIDLFSGAGFFGLAFALEGFELASAYEASPIAAATHERNLPGDIVRCDLSLVAPENTCDVLIAGPPCQGFSSIGKKKASDPRNFLCLVVPKWAAVTKPRVVVVENVQQFLQSEAWVMMNAEMLAQGYRMQKCVLNAKDFGVAQNRVRSFTFYTSFEMEEIRFTPKVPLTVGDAFCGLPSFPDTLLQHETMRVTDLQMERIRHVPSGGDIRDISVSAPELVPHSWRSTSGKIVDIWGRLEWNGISNAIRTGFHHPSRGRFLHPSESRPISFREAARLQTLPDWFGFAGVGQQISRQIGNGVPISLGRTVAKLVKDILLNK